MVVKMRLTVDVEYQSNGADPYDLKLVLKKLIRIAAGNGALQGGTDAVVISWGATALDVTNEPEPDECHTWVARSDEISAQCETCGLLMHEHLGRFS